MLLSHPNRLDRVFILTQDPILACDVSERIEADKHLAGLEIVRPVEHDGIIKRESLLALAPETVTGRLLIFDVRSFTLARLQEIYNRVAGYNRRDLNELCYSLVIGDAPGRYPFDQIGIDVFHKHLAKMRIDYNPAACFFDPLIHYSPDECRGLQRLGRDEVPHKIPDAWAQTFKAGVGSLETVRAYFRASDVTSLKRKREMRHRLAELERFIIRRAEANYPQQSKGLSAAMSRKGCKLSGESLRLYLYPFRFEKWLALLWDEARKETKK